MADHEMTDERRTAATTFREEEVRILYTILRTILRGGDVQVLVSKPAFASAMAKVTRMHDKVTQERGET